MVSRRKRKLRSRRRAARRHDAATTLAGSIGSPPPTIPVVMMVGFGRLVATGVPWHPDTIPQPVSKAARDSVVWALRREGLSISQIEERTGFGHGAVQRAVRGYDDSTIQQAVSVSGKGRLRGKIHREHANPDGPWALVRWAVSRYSYRMLEPVQRFATEEDAYAAAAGLTDEEPWTVVRTDQTAEGRILDDERPTYDGDYLDDDLDDDDLDDSPPKRNGQQPETHPWRGNVSAATRSDAGYFFDLVSTIPPVAITGTGRLGAVAVADRLLAQI